MKPAPFAYERPTTVSEVVDLLSGGGGETKLLAGGQSLVPILALRLARFDQLVDLNRVTELSGIRRENGHTVVGSMTRQAVIERDPTVAEGVPLLSRATPLIGHFQIRNRGTIGGSLAHADPASEYPAVVLALGGDLEVVGPAGARTVAADDFFLSTWTTALGEDEVLTAVRLPDWGGRSGFAVEEVARRYGDFALVGACGAVKLDDQGLVERAGVALFGVAETPFRSLTAEAGLVGRRAADLDPAAVADLARRAAEELEPPEDVHASRSYRRQVAAVVLTRCLTRAVEEASAHV